jgi:hypothetical protein
VGVVALEQWNRRAQVLRAILNYSMIEKAKRTFLPTDTKRRLM